ncbi:MAG: hypothetical protein ACKOC8_07765 [Pirellulales bacterium]
MPAVTSSAVSPSSAAATLLAARRVLVTGFQGIAVEAVLAACDLAERLGAAIDAGDVEGVRSTAPTIARVGEVTADPAELRDRADLVVFWCCDPEAACPGFIDRFVAPPTTPARHRQTLTVTPNDAAGGPDHRHVQLPHEAAVEAARGVQLLVEGGTLDASDPVAAACHDIHKAIAAATCVAFVTDDSGDPSGLAAWSLVHLVRAIAHRTPAFEVPLRPRAAIVEAVCTWRYGAAGAIARADRAGAAFLPGEASAERLVARGEVDAVLVVGDATPAAERSLAAAMRSLAVIRVAGPTLTNDLRAIEAAIPERAPGAAP